MKRIAALVILAVILLGYALPVYAACTTHTYLVGGRTVVCTTCCYSGQCTTSCF